MTAPVKRHKQQHPPLVTLRALREALGITRGSLVDRLAEQGYLAENTNVIRGVETGWQKPSYQLIVAWARALRLNPADVILPNSQNGDSGDDGDDGSAA